MSEFNGAARQEPRDGFIVDGKHGHRYPALAKRDHDDARPGQLLHQPTQFALKGLLIEAAAGQYDTIDPVLQSSRIIASSCCGSRCMLATIAINERSRAAIVTVCAIWPKCGSRMLPTIKPSDGCSPREASWQAGWARTGVSRRLPARASAAQARLDMTSREAPGRRTDRYPASRATSLSVACWSLLRSLNLELQENRAGSLVKARRCFKAPTRAGGQKPGHWI